MVHRYIFSFSFQSLDQNVLWSSILFKTLHNAYIAYDAYKMDWRDQFWSSEWLKQNKNMFIKNHFDMEMIFISEQSLFFVCQPII